MAATKSPRSKSCSAAYKYRFKFFGEFYSSYSINMMNFNKMKIKKYNWYDKCEKNFCQPFGGHGPLWSLGSAPVVAKYLYPKLMSEL